MSYGFGRAYRIGNLCDAGLGEAWRPTLAGGRCAGFRGLCRSVWRELVAGERQLVNWHELIVARSLVPVPAHGAS
jgi:hypothetical protein